MDQRLELMPVETFFEREKIDMFQLRRRLRNVIMSTDPALGDTEYMDRILAEAQKRAAERGLEVLTADEVLLRILRRPSESIRACIEQAHEDPPPEPEQDEFQTKRNKIVMAAVEKTKREHRGLYSSDKSSPMPIPTPEPDPDLMRNGGPIFEAADDSELHFGGAPRDKMTALVEVVKKTRSALLEKIFGQDNAVSVFTNGYFQGQLSAMLEKERKRPKATFLFAGPPGVGKTYLAETAAEVLRLPYKRFDMSEYADKEATIQLCGADSVYRDSHPGHLSGFVAEHPECILLFDEIEKAHINVIHLFLQILDAGRLTDAKTKKEVSFADAIVIFTTNAGKALYEETEGSDLSGLSRKAILVALGKDINPETKAPFFPPAICSRFASGNVVMFNHMTAHNLRYIAKSVFKQQAENLERGMKIKTQIDERIYTALLLAEGGSADARMIRGRSQSFFNVELFELLRLIDSEKAKTDIKEVEEIRFTLQLPEEEPEIRALFEPPQDMKALVFAPKKLVTWCKKSQSACGVLGAQSEAEAAELLKKNDVHFALLDIGNPEEQEDEKRFLNLEDIDSEARNVFWYIKEKHPGTPIYLIVDAKEEITLEEQISFRKAGVQGFLAAHGSKKLFAEKIGEICEQLHQQRNIDSLAKANKLISFETGQRISADGRRAEICLFDFELGTAVDAEDSKNILSSISRPDVHFADVIGAEEAKRELQFYVEYLRDPKKFMGTGVSTPKGVLLYGPPGTGKTMLAKAMACEADVTFLAAEGNQFLKKYSGEGPDSVRDLFRTARKYAPSIIFVDEIDAIAKQRTGAENTEQREEILTGFLTQMDGFRTDPTRPVFVLAATNFDVERGKQTSLDEAFLRRFDRRVFVDLPKKEERIRFLRQEFAKKPIFQVSDMMLENIAVRSTGMSLAALASVLELSLRMAVREGSLKVTDAVLEDAFETFNSGEVKKWDPDELERTARHEAGHALLCWLSGETPSYLTVVARAYHGGYMQRGDRENKQVMTKDELLASIRTALGGRAAEILCYGEEGGLSTGASADLVSATRTARKIVCTYGMDSGFGLAVIGPEDAQSKEVLAAVNKILAGEMKKAISLLEANRGALDRLAAELIAKNRLTGSQIESILGKSR